MAARGARGGPPFADAPPAVQQAFEAVAARWSKVPAVSTDDVRARAKTNVLLQAGVAVDEAGKPITRAHEGRVYVVKARAFEAVAKHFERL